jgi:hypothetical protein
VMARSPGVGDCQGEVAGEEWRVAEMARKYVQRSYAR